MKQILAFLPIIIFTLFFSAQFTPVPESDFTFDEWNKQLYPYLKEHEFWLLFGR